MRYRFSVWDAVFIVLTGAVVAVGIWVLQAGPSSVPLHYNIAGEPDRWGPPSFMNVIGVPLFVLLSSYPLLRLIDLYLLASKPQYYGFMTTVGGGMGLILCGLFVPSRLQMLFGYQVGGWYMTALLGLLFVFLGVMFATASPEKVLINNPGLFADTPAGRRIFLRSTGIGFVITGLLIVPCAFLPGDWSMLSLVVMMFGPVVGLIVGITRAPKAS